ncbi:hypothetical protein GFER_05090 [Geoalkalibacter ferrihydriticus DSM 17813]|uniref:Uncharacterized protein n=1 Tax=Geoalkalibacter ferrihydriticus DSM 17813 TaxID=1121915 RepID=A0A0C2HLK3_9BACT|nr:hypothetical protein GFER_05090 [Geoalkalibacter ferrihydriticus DSM 17813]
MVCGRATALPHPPAKPRAGRTHAGAAVLCGGRCAHGHRAHRLGQLQPAAFSPQRAAQPPARTGDAPGTRGIFRCARDLRTALAGEPTHCHAS